MTTFREEERIYLLQISLRAVKACQACCDVLPVQEFGGYRCQPCEACLHKQKAERGIDWAYRQQLKKINALRDKTRTWP